MYISNEKIFSEFYERRKKEHFPLHYFILEKGLEISDNSFWRKYHRWLYETHRDFPILSPQDYINWFTTKYNLQPVTYRQSKPFSFTPLVIACGVIHQNFEKPDLEEISRVSGMTEDVIMRFVRSGDVKNPVKNKPNSIPIKDKTNS